MPQFDPSSFASQIFWLVITFVALYFLMSRVVLPRIAEVLEERSERIADDIERADALRKEAEAVIARYEAALTKGRAEASAMLAGTQRDIDRTITDRTREFEAQLSDRLRKADDRITEAKNEAMRQVRDIAVDVTGDITTRLTGETADGAVIASAVDRQLSEVAR